MNKQTQGLMTSDCLTLWAIPRCTIRGLAEAIAALTEFTGRLVFGHTKPDDAPRKLMDTSKLNAFCWSPAIGLREGLQSSYDWFVANHDKFRG